MIKSLNKVNLEGTYLNVVKAMYEIPTANIILNGEKLSAFSLKAGTRQRCPVLQLLFHTVLEVLATAIWQEKEIRSIHIGKWSLFIADIIQYIENPKKTPPKTTRNNK